MRGWFEKRGGMEVGSIVMAGSMMPQKEALARRRRSRRRRRRRRRRRSRRSRRRKKSGRKRRRRLWRGPRQAEMVTGDTEHQNLFSSIITT